MSRNSKGILIVKIAIVVLALAGAIAVTILALEKIKGIDVAREILSSGLTSEYTLHERASNYMNEAARVYRGAEDRENLTDDEMYNFSDKLIRMDVALRGYETMIEIIDMYIVGNRLKPNRELKAITAEYIEQYETDFSAYPVVQEYESKIDSYCGIVNRIKLGNTVSQEEREEAVKIAGELHDGLEEIFELNDKIYERTKEQRDILKQSVKFDDTLWWCMAVIWLYLVLITAMIWLIR